MSRRSPRDGTFWTVMAERYGLTLDIAGGALANIPQDKPVILIANHPYGILDGLMMGHILAQTRGDFRILANHVFRKAEDLNKVILPVDFAETREAVQTEPANPQGGAQLSGAGRRHRHLSRRHRFHRGASHGPSDGPGLARLHRPDGRQIRCGCGAGVL